LKKPNENLIEKIVGQDDAYNSITKAVTRRRGPLFRQNQPIGSLLFVGNFI
jgi:ATP-dependent Clp protease ATP-binding subunit ClpA